MPTQLPPAFSVRSTTVPMSRWRSPPNERLCPPTNGLPTPSPPISRSAGWALLGRTERQARRPVLLRHLLLIRPRQLHVHPEIPIQVRLRAIEVEIADRQAAQIAADPWINRFAHDAVHARERADVDDPRRALLRQVHHLADIQHHLAERPLARQIRTRAFQHVVDVGLLAAYEIVLERLHQYVLVVLLHALAHPRAQSL